MKTAEYWRQRFTQLEDAQNKIGASALREIEKQYAAAQRQIEGKIAAWYQRFADNNEITLAEARQWLTGKDLKEFKWDVQEYIKYGQENALMGGWSKELENASAKFHISKLEALKIYTQQSLEELYAKQGVILSDTMGKTYRSGYYHTAYELQKGFNIGWDIAGIDQAQIEKVLVKPWATDGYNFSERIWNNKNRLIQEVHKELTRNIMLGADPQKAIDAIARKMNTSKHNAGRLVMTEEAYFSSLAQKDCFRDLDVEQYEIVATLDSRTSDICREMDGRHFPMKDFQPGETAPPFHVYCRSTTVPYFEDDLDSIGERAARDEEGKTYYVPADMKYKEWKKVFVDGGEKEGLTKNLDLDDMQVLSYGKDIDDKAIETIYNTIKRYENRGDFFISDVALKSLPQDKGSTPVLQIEAVPAGRKASLKLNINQDFFAGRTLEEIDAVFKNARNTVCNSLKEATIHEAGHAKLISGKSIDEIEKLYDELKSEGVEAISKISENDGVEAIAEIEVLISRNGPLSEKAEKLYSKYLGGVNNDLCQYTMRLM